MNFWPDGDGDVPLSEMSQDDFRKKYGIEQFEFPYPDSQIRHIGFAPKDQKWYGWSHRAIYGFKVGDKVKPGDVVAPDPEYPRPDREIPVGFVAKTLDDARRMAASFADAVS